MGALKNGLFGAGIGKSSVRRASLSWSRKLLLVPLHQGGREVAGGGGFYAGSARTRFRGPWASAGRGMVVVWAAASRSGQFLAARCKWQNKNVNLARPSIMYWQYNTTRSTNHRTPATTIEGCTTPHRCFSLRFPLCGSSRPSPKTDVEKYKTAMIADENFHGLGTQQE